MRFLPTEYSSDDVEVKERLLDSSILQADNDLLSDALKREHAAELRLESAIENDIATKKELERIIGNKAMLKQEFRDLENTIHQCLALKEREGQEVHV